MNTIVTPERIELPAGTIVKLLGNWEDYQRMVLLLGDRTIPRIKYRTGESKYSSNVARIVQQCLQIASEQTTSDAIRWLRKFLMAN